MVKHVYYMASSASGQDGAILPAREYPYVSRKKNFLESRLGP